MQTEHSREQRGQLIALTPRHITKFAVEILSVDLQDIIYDPTCGTGGFLVAALDYMKTKSSPNQVDDFKLHNIFGLEQEPEVLALALVNMIFRGDGKANITDGDCFQNHLKNWNSNGHRSAKYTKGPNEKQEPVTKILMNPPFALKTTDEKEHRFIDAALRQMQDGGLLFSVLPVGTMHRPNVEQHWRKNILLSKNTLVAVITFPPDLFYPINVHTLGIVIKKGIPHQPHHKVLWIRANHDGFTKLKNKRLPALDEPNDILENQSIIKAFVNDPSLPIDSVLGKRKAAEIDFSDPRLELVPEVYLDSSCPSIHEINDALEENIRNAASYLVQNNLAKYARASGANNDQLITIKQDRRTPNEIPEFKTFNITNLFNPLRGDFHALSKLEPGDIPTVSRIEGNNGIVGYKNKPAKAKIYPPLTPTVSTVTGDTFVQLSPFIATDNVLILHAKRQFSPETLFYIQTMVNMERWRCTYGRQVYMDKFSRTEIFLPVNSKEQIDEEYIAEAVRGCSYWSIVGAHIDTLQSLP